MSTLRQLAELVRGDLVGDADLQIVAARPLTEARPGDISFLENERHARLLASCTASAVVVPEALSIEGRSVIRVADPLAAFILIVQHLEGPDVGLPAGIDPRAAIHPRAQIGPDARIGPFSVVGEGTVIGARCTLHPGAVVGPACRLGDDVTLFAHAVLYEGTVLGNRVMVHANAVLGADGFGYRFQNGRHVKVPQLSHVEVGDDVEIGACSTIDCGTFQPTRIGAGTKIDNLVMVAHNCQIGRHNLLVSQVGIAGSTSTGDHVTLAGQVGVKDHIRIGSRVLVGAKSGVMKDVPEGGRVIGIPAIPVREQQRNLRSLEKVPELRREVRRILQHLGLEEDKETGRQGDKEVA